MTTTIAPHTTDATLAHYNSIADRYGAFFGDGGPDAYPANAKRWELVRHRIKETNARTIIEAGCGEGSPLKVLKKQMGLGAIVRGFDFSPEMAAEAEKKLPGDVWQGDITDPAAFRGRHFESVIALGPFPHLNDEEQAAAIKNCADATTKGGRVYVELRNELFAAFTLNRHTVDYYVGMLPEDVPDDILAKWISRFDTDQPPPLSTDVASYDSSFSRFNDPGDVRRLFGEAGLTVATIHPYHAHVVPPMFEKSDPEWFRRESLAMEWPNPEYTSLKTLLRCSAFVVEARKD